MVEKNPSGSTPSAGAGTKRASDACAKRGGGKVRMRKRRHVEKVADLESKGGPQGQRKMV